MDDYNMLLYPVATTQFPTMPNGKGRKSAEMSKAPKMMNHDESIPFGLLISKIV